MDDVSPGFGRSANQAGWEALTGGGFHVGYAALAVVVVGLLLLSVSLWAGVVLLVLGTGILVDVWAHEFWH